MTQIQQNKSLKKYNTFGVEAIAKQFVKIETIAQLKNILKYNQDVFILSGGSNILLTQNISKLVIYINTKGKSVVSEDENFVIVKVQSGENWHDFVLWSITKNYGGLENLSLIPGKVGTCPIQNIGAYGVEVKDTIVEVEALDITSQTITVFKNKECKFGYRSSIFKNELKGNYVITSVTFKLSKKNHHLNYSYGAIAKELADKKLSPSIQSISDAVISIRQQKLPNPKILGNSGSFFKNPIVSTKKFSQLQQKHPTIPNYKIATDLIKIPAGWFIEQCGFKGKKIGNVGAHKNQALVLVNYGNATGAEIIKLAEEIRTNVKNKFGIALQFEVNII